MRLIDADALYENMMYEMCGTGYQTPALQTIRRAPTIDTPPNDPLTLDELRKMNGEPVWLCDEKCYGEVVVRDEKVAVDTQWALYTNPIAKGICRRKPDDNQHEN